MRATEGERRWWWAGEERMMWMFVGGWWSFVRVMMRLCINSLFDVGKLGSQNLYSLT